MGLVQQTAFSVAMVDATGAVVCVTDQTVFTYQDDAPTVAAELEAILYNSVAQLGVYDAYDATGENVETGQKVGKDYHPGRPPVIRRKTPPGVSLPPPAQAGGH